MRLIGCPIRVPAYLPGLATCTWGKYVFWGHLVHAVARYGSSCMTYQTMLLSNGARATGSWVGKVEANCRLLPLGFSIENQVAMQRGSVRWAEKAAEGEGIFVELVWSWRLINQWGTPRCWAAR